MYAMNHGTNNVRSDEDNALEYKFRVTQIIDPHNFFAQVSNDADFRDFTVFEHYMNQHFNSVQQVEVDVENLVTGQPIATYCRDQKQWKRATVGTVNCDTEEVDVFHIDYGTAEIVNVEDICVTIPPEIHQRTPEALRCRLMGARPIATHWISRATSRFRELVNQRVLRGYLYPQGDIAQGLGVCLYQDGKALSDILCEEFLAQSDGFYPIELKNSPTKPTYPPEKRTGDPPAIPSFNLNAFNRQPSFDTQKSEETSPGVDIEKEIMFKNVEPMSPSEPYPPGGETEDGSMPNIQEQLFQLQLKNDKETQSFEENAKVSTKSPASTHKKPTRAPYVDENKPSQQEFKKTNQKRQDIAEPLSWRKGPQEVAPRFRKLREPSPDDYQRPGKKTPPLLAQQREKTNITRDNRTHWRDEDKGEDYDGKYRNRYKERNAPPRFNKPAYNRGSPNKSHDGSGDYADIEPPKYNQTERAQPITKKKPEPVDKLSDKEKKKNEYDWHSLQFGHKVSNLLNTVTLDNVESTISALHDLVYPEKSMFEGLPGKKELYLCISDIVERAMEKLNHEFYSIAAQIVTSFKETSPNFDDVISGVLWDHQGDFVKVSDKESDILIAEGYCTLLATLYCYVQQWHTSHQHTGSGIEMCLIQSAQKWILFNKRKQHTNPNALYNLYGRCFQILYNTAGAYLEMAIPLEVDSWFEELQEKILDEDLPRHVREELLAVLLQRKKNQFDQEKTEMSAPPSETESVTTSSQTDPPVGEEGLSESKESVSIHNSTDSVDWDPSANIKAMLKNLKLEHLLEKFEEFGIRDAVLELDANELKDLLKECGFRIGHIMEIKMYLTKQSGSSSSRSTPSMYSTPPRHVSVEPPPQPTQQTIQEPQISRHTSLEPQVQNTAPVSSMAPLPSKSNNIDLITPDAFSISAKAKIAQGERALHRAKSPYDDKGPGEYARKQEQSGYIKQPEQFMTQLDKSAYAKQPDLYAKQEDQSSYQSEQPSHYAKQPEKSGKQPDEYAKQKGVLTSAASVLPSEEAVLSASKLLSNSRQSNSAHESYPKTHNNNSKRQNQYKTGNTPPDQRADPRSLRNNRSSETSESDWRKSRPYESYSRPSDGSSRQPVNIPAKKESSLYKNPPEELFAPSYLNNETMQGMISGKSPESPSARVPEDVVYETMQSMRNESRKKIGSQSPPGFRMAPFGTSPPNQNQQSQSYSQDRFMNASNQQKSKPVVDYSEPYWMSGRQRPHSTIPDRQPDVPFYKTGSKDDMAMDQTLQYRGYVKEQEQYNRPTSGRSHNDIEKDQHNGQKEIEEIKNQSEQYEDMAHEQDNHQNNNQYYSSNSYAAKLKDNPTQPEKAKYSSSHKTEPVVLKKRKNSKNLEEVNRPQAAVGSIKSLVADWISHPAASTNTEDGVSQEEGAYSRERQQSDEGRRRKRSSGEISYPVLVNSPPDTYAGHVNPPPPKPQEAPIDESEFPPLGAEPSKITSPRSYLPPTPNSDVVSSEYNPNPAMDYHQSPEYGQETPLPSLPQYNPSSNPFSRPRTGFGSARRFCTLCHEEDHQTYNCPQRAKNFFLH
ncbi:unnamed protein product [Owenia fusiformis]|uniref:Tudor domain-containing protein n=1 Tax=Owenia fusiformis TaxID=6347 RepID=A0A8S4NND3_OWEFU|nr:unnamed protein product [Owenia fusiformis]